MSPAKRAVAALRTAADALAAVPPAMRRSSLLVLGFQATLTPAQLRAEAAYIEARVAEFTTATTDDLEPF